MRPHVHFRTTLGDELSLGHGDLIGRLWSAAWRIDDPRISEAHAAVSLRSDELRLLSLRGRLRVADRVLAEVRLEPGLHVWLADGIGMEVLDVALPAETLGLEAAGLPRMSLRGACSLYAEGQARILPGLQPDAAAWVWGDGEQWSLRDGQGESRPLLLGDQIQLGPALYRVVAMTLGRSGPGQTLVPGASATPMVVVARFDTVHVYSEGELRAVLDGIPARIVSELVALGGPVRWQLLAEEVWGKELDATTLRNRLDVALVRLRRTLRDGRLRPDLVRMTGTGHIELLLHPLDRVEDAL
jgi:hypothetical protein